MSALEQDLDPEFMGDAPDLEAVPEPPQDAEDANRKLRRIAALKARIAEHDAFHQAETRRLDEWLDRVETPIRREIRWLAEGLEMWHRAILSEDPGRKTISLPCGTLKSRSQPPQWVFDDDLFIAWALDEQNAPELVRIPEPKPQVDKAAAKKLLAPSPDGQMVFDTGTGQVVPGVTVVVRGRSFSVVTEEVDR